MGIRGVEGLSKKEKGLMGIDYSVVIAEWGEEVGGSERGYKGNK